MIGLVAPVNFDQTNLKIFWGALKEIFESTFCIYKSIDHHNNTINKKNVYISFFFSIVIIDFKVDSIQWKVFVKYEDGLNFSDFILKLKWMIHHFKDNKTLKIHIKKKNQINGIWVQI